MEDRKLSWVIGEASRRTQLSPDDFASSQDWVEAFTEQWEKNFSAALKEFEADPLEDE